MIGKKLTELRKIRSISQENLAERLNVSRQTIQKWESDTSTPDISNLIALSELFGITMEELLGIASKQKQNMRYPSEKTPDYENMGGAFYDQLLLEFQQASEEGKDIAFLSGLFTEINKLPNSRAKKDLSEIACRMINSAPQRIDYPYNEPSDIGSIMLLSDFPEAEKIPDCNILRDKIRGAWLGRIIGCDLGKPLEGMHRKDMIPGLTACGNYPIHRYVTSDDATDTFKPNLLATIDAIEKAEAAAVDDDTNYTAMATYLIDHYGRDFTPYELARLWVNVQIKEMYCTAEQVAFVNTLNGYRPPDTATRYNPYREWVGAQIRADYYGYINPGNPGAAAEYAFRDASISHVKNGIYGSMFVAAMISRAAVSSNTSDIVRTGLRCIPKTSRLYKAVSEVIDGYENGINFSDWSARFNKEWNDEIQHHWCHVISNACIVTAAVLYGKGDFSESISLAVSEAFDTDCNGATVGSIIGMMCGASAILEKWYKPFHGKLRTSINTIGTVTIDELIEKTMTHIANK